MKIEDIFNSDFLKIFNFLYTKYYSTKGELFNEKTLINAGVGYHAKISHYLDILKKLQIITLMRFDGIGNMKIYNINIESEAGMKIKDLYEYLKEWRVVLGYEDSEE